MSHSPHQPLRVALAQIRCEKAAIHENLAVIADVLTEAEKRQVDIVGFPEMSLTGYADPTRYPEAIITLDGPEVAALLEVSHHFSGMALVGLIERNPAGKPFITHIVVRQGALVGAYRKVTIKDEEELWFSPGEDVPVFEYNGLMFGVAICADIENREVFARCQAQGARVVFELAAPGLYGAQETRDWKLGYDWWEGDCRTFLGQYAKELGVWIFVATQAGRTRDEDFPGGGFVFNPMGERVFATENWAEGVEFLEVDLLYSTLERL
ncbi:MAG TPA: carbon-nitrogen hydrolase family protein [Anaerolineales bacterium]|nr:carbon-nitrogen hydrolase family protein [Anaerolineales bacterium]